MVGSQEIKRNLRTRNVPRSCRRQTTARLQLAYAAVVRVGPLVACGNDDCSRCWDRHHLDFARSRGWTWTSNRLVNSLSALRALPYLYFCIDSPYWMYTGQQWAFVWRSSVSLLRLRLSHNTLSTALKEPLEVSFNPATELVTSFSRAMETP